MVIVKSKYGGFCFGVKRAVEKAKELKGDNNFVLGEIVHNESVTNDLLLHGVKKIDSLFDANLSVGDNVLIRSHGEAKRVFDYASEKGINIIDCTCPFVKKIHDIVNEHHLNGYKIVIIGDENHPEVIGINGWCDNSALITKDYKEILSLQDEKVCIVVQTTFPEEEFDKIIKKIEHSTAKTVDIFKTICYTTSKRQIEARDLSLNCDAMLVIGGKNSNNTNNLFEICRKNCENTFRVYDAKQFDYVLIKNFNKVGIVLGASTPDEQFQEVVSNMENITEETKIVETEEGKETETVEKVANSEEVKVDNTPKSEMEAAFDNIKPNRDYHPGQIITAIITSANDGGLTISLKNTKKDFELPKEEMLNEYVKEDYKDKIGQDIKVMVVGKNPVRFSEKALTKIMEQEAEIEEVKNGKIFEAVIKTANKGGLTAEYSGYQVFVPASQIKIGFVKELDKYVGKTLRLKAESVESKGSRRQIVASQKVILLAEKEERDAIRAQKEAEFFAAINEGDVVLGKPVRFTNFGAFIDVNGFDCLAHISDLSWTGCNDCSEVLELNKEYEFKILKIDQETKRVSVGYKQLQPKPWDSVLERYNVGDVIKGKVVRIVKFGAFVEVEKGIDGLVHVSQISDKWLENPVTALQVGQEIDAKILDINPEKEKMTLSIKALIVEQNPAPVEEAEEKTDEKPAKGKKRAAKKQEEEPDELHEWKDETSEASIADIINKNND